MTSLLPAYDLARVRAAYPEAPKERSALLALARAAQQAERWDDMLRFARDIVRTAQLATPGADLTPEERVIFTTAAKQNLSALRAAWRACKLDDSVRDVVDEYKAHLERQLLSLTVELAQLLETTLLRAVMSPEPQIYYRKLVGDFYRYLAEIAVPGAAVLPGANLSAPPTAPPAPGASASSVIPLGYEEKSLQAYQVAMRLSSTHLEPTHPTRLGLCLNYSVLLFEVLKDKKPACELARAAFDAAIAKLDDLDEASYKDTTLLMQLLRDNLTLWTAQDQVNETEVPTAAK